MRSAVLKPVGAKRRRPRCRNARELDAMAGKGQGPRAAAVVALGLVLGERAALRDVIADPDGPFARLTAPDRARAQRLTLSVLRHLEQADRALGPALRKAPPPFVLNALRLAVVEIVVEGAAAHGAVNAAVEIVRHGNRTGHLGGLVNAVLRKVTTRPAPFEGLPPQRMPLWLRQPLVRLWGRETVSAIERVQANAPPLDLTLRNDNAMPEWGEGIAAQRLPTGSWRLTGPVQVSALPGYDTGAWWVQDAAAALAARVLAVQPGERVLDMGAAPGGKTMQMAALGARVTALDISGPRMERLRANLLRTGLPADVVVGDALHWEPEVPFDAILLDAPCSATGTIRRHPDLPFVKDGTELEALAALQIALLDRALTFLKPGGRVVFCTCSLLPEEGEDQLRAALKRHPGLNVERAQVAGIEDGWRTLDGALRLRPDHWAEKGGIDGFFIVCLRKAG